MLLVVVAVMVAVFADIDTALRWRAVGIVGGNIKGIPIPTEDHARNIDVNGLVAETDLEAALLGLPAGGIGDIRGVIKVHETSVGLLCEFGVQLRKIERKRRAAGVV